MSKVVVQAGDVQVDARVIAEALRVAPEMVQPCLRERRIASQLERGVDEDAGKYRLTFVYGRRKLQLVVDEAGEILERRTTERDARPPSSGSRAWRGPVSPE